MTLLTISHVASVSPVILSRDERIVRFHRIAILVETEFMVATRPPPLIHIRNYLLFDILHFLHLRLHG